MFLDILMLVNEKILNEILDYLDNSVTSLAQQQDFTEWNDLNTFVERQYDIRLDNLLQNKASGIHHLESGLKNKVIMRKQLLMNNIKEQFFTK